MKFSNIFSSFILLLLVISCSQFGDSFRLPGEKSKDIIYFELDNDYLAPESREYIELNYSSNDVSNSFILIGKNTYGFEADLSNDMSLSFDEDGSLRKTIDALFNLSFQSAQSLLVSSVILSPKDFKFSEEVFD